MTSVLLCFPYPAILSSPEEHASWKSNNTIPHDGLAFHNALFMRTCCIGGQRQWPLLIDPDDQVMTWVKLLHDRGVISFHDGLAFDEGIGKKIMAKPKLIFFIPVANFHLLKKIFTNIEVNKILVWV